MESPRFGSGGFHLRFFNEGIGKRIADVRCDAGFGGRFKILHFFKMYFL